MDVCQGIIKVRLTDLQFYLHQNSLTSVYSLKKLLTKARRTTILLSKPGVPLCYTSYIISCHHAVQYTVVFFFPLVTCIRNDRYFLSTAPGHSDPFFLRPSHTHATFQHFTEVKKTTTQPHARNISTQHLATLLLLTRHLDRTSLFKK